MTEPTKFVFFGDSLSDPGNLYDLGEGIVDEGVRNSIGGPTNSVSDGIVFTEYLDQIAGDGAALNYAIAGALAGGSLSLGELIGGSIGEDDLLVPLDDPALDFDINLSAQVDRFTDDFEGQDVSDYTAFILIGGNDYSGIDTSDIAGAVAEFASRVLAAVGDTLASVLQLQQAGVSQIVVSTLPDSIFFPRAIDLSPAEQAVSQLAFGIHNALLTAGIEALADNGIAVEIIDLGPISRALAGDPENFGFLAPLSDTLTEAGGAVLDDFAADQVAFFDDIHPSTAAHGVIAAYLAHALENPVHEYDDQSNFALLGGADDLIFANGGNDIVLAGQGNDLGFGGEGEDVLWSGGGDDLTSGGSGHDTIRAGAGADILDGDSGDDALMGGLGDDLLVDGLGSDTAYGGFGSDSFVFTQSDLIGGDAPDDDYFIGGLGHDTLYLVVDAATAQALGAEVSTQELSDLGLTITGIEEIIIVPGRDNLDTLSDQVWFAQADIWGVI
ncbi:phospholipase/lecithinase/hemolysin-like protein [Actibacterium atlanticum]|uniref:Phospholipase/lecithinase/hemolysin-like protein n=1 Tax=Actibacterium atlanticum TaxID=1461693 RepID=A0A058ZK54_9RHOB|nr:SGNH/GDSL hydrolase family protein [Actibacterium atlanticum]KCV81567.1 phospholipase/lecithinase/hemolysin-like protein [Actibacterium atlanticum]